MSKNGNYPHIIQNFKVFDCLNFGFEDGKVEELAENECIKVMRREESNCCYHIPDAFIGIKSFRDIIIIEL